MILLNHSIPANYYIAQFSTEEGTLWILSGHVSGPCTVTGHVPTLPWVKFRVWAGVGLGLGLASSSSLFLASKVREPAPRTSWLSRPPCRGSAGWKKNNRETRDVLFLFRSGNVLLTFLMLSKSAGGTVICKSNKNTMLSGSVMVFTASCIANVL